MIHERGALIYLHLIVEYGKYIYTKQLYAL